MMDGRTTARIHALWDELADFGAHDVDAALTHALRVLSELIDAQRAFWLAAMRLGTAAEQLGGWRMRGIRRLNPIPEDDQVYKLSRQRLEHGESDQVTLAQVRGAGVFRVSLLRELASPAFFDSPDYDVLYRQRDIRDALFVTFPLNEDAESYFGWYRSREESGPFTLDHGDVLAYALRALKWFHRRVMLHHGFLIAKAPLSQTERRIVSLMLTERSEKEIAQELSLTVATTHTYITDLFWKFGVSGRPGLAALWLGRSTPSRRR